MTNKVVNSTKTDPKLILASQSPRRRELLAQLGYQFSVQASDIDETVESAETAYGYVLRLAEQKAQHVLSLLPQAERASSFVLGSDTSLVYKGKILGKPDSRED